MRCGSTTGGVEEPDARRREREEGGERERKKARTRKVEEERDRPTQGERKEGWWNRREGEDEEGGSEALEGRRSQCTAGECNARQYGALRQRVHSTALYNASFSLSLSLVATIHAYASMLFRPAQNLSRCAKLLYAISGLRIDCRYALSSLKVRFFVRDTVDLDIITLYMITTTKFVNLIVSDCVIKSFTFAGLTRLLLYTRLSWSLSLRSVCARIVSRSVHLSAYKLQIYLTEFRVVGLSIVFIIILPDNIFSIS